MEIVLTADEFSFEDAIAIEYFMLNANEFLDASKDEDSDVVSNLVLLATASYCLADVFCSVRKERIKKNQQAIEETDNV